MKALAEGNQLNLRAVTAFSFRLILSACKLIKLAIFKRKDWERLSSEVSELYSRLWDYAEHSISHGGFTLPTAVGNDPVHRVNRLLLQLYGAQFASLSPGGSSGALITFLTAVLPKLQKDRDLILFDDMCHQSAIGGIIFGRWKAARLPRTSDPLHKTVRPLTCDLIRKAIETYGAKRIAAILLVTPTYDGFSSPAENEKIYKLAKSHDITVIIDGPWDSTRFRRSRSSAPDLGAVCDIWISSPHKRGLTPSGLGCVITGSAEIAKLWDEALDLGFRSSSVSFVEIMIAEHRLQKIAAGDWDEAFSKAQRAAENLRGFIPTLHPNLYVVTPEDVDAGIFEPAHILVSAHRLPGFDARQWANILASQFGLDVEKATASTLLLLCASPAHFYRLKEIKMILKESFDLTFSQGGKSHDK